MVSQSTTTSKAKVCQSTTDTSATTCLQGMYIIRLTDMDNATTWTIDTLHDNNSKSINSWSCPEGNNCFTIMNPLSEMYMIVKKIDGELIVTTSDDCTKGSSEWNSGQCVWTTNNKERQLQNLYADMCLGNNDDTITLETCPTTSVWNINYN